MWKPRLDFISLHYAYIIFMGILGVIVLYPYGNLRAIDAYFFGASASTESGLNTVDVKDLKTYQQLYLYFIPIFTNLGFINILVVVVRLYWFERRLKEAAPDLFERKPKRGGDTEAAACDVLSGVITASASSGMGETQESLNRYENDADVLRRTYDAAALPDPVTGISFADDVKGRTKALYIPPPWERDRGHPIVEVDSTSGEIEIERATTRDSQVTAATCTTRRRKTRVPLLSNTLTIERVATSAFVFGASTGRSQRLKTQPIQMTPLSEQLALPELSSHATVGRNSQFQNLTKRDRDLLGGIEYRSLKLLLKIVISYFFGLHLLGAICLLPWIRYTNPKYPEYLKECGQNSIWWAFYSAQTMVDNLGFTLTPDSMITFRDAAWPMLVMSFLAYAGNTCYPCILRLVIWTIFKLCPKRSSLKEPLYFLLEHPRRCYTLLFPSKPTWVLFGILFGMNFVDVILIIALDLHNPEVSGLATGPRIMAAIFQAASARHTGTSSFNLANVHPAVQFSLLVMMYIAIFPIAISVRASNIYEEKALGIYPSDEEMNEKDSRTYILTHVRNQLTFDLWYIFLGIFCICIAESDKIMNSDDPAFAVFPIFFEVTSAYGNVGLSLGYPTVSTSLSGQFTTFSKLVICAMMIRGRHRGLPYQLDRAILLPSDQRDSEYEGIDDQPGLRSLYLDKIKRFHTA
ncbi:putative cation transporter [Aspergillus carlsbadensis]|nr:putative cation transporter [Aspergillus carlsbadensis]